MPTALAEPAMAAASGTRGDVQAPDLQPRGSIAAELTKGSIAAEVGDLRRRAEAMEQHLQHLQRASEASSTAMTQIVTDLRTLIAFLDVQQDHTCSAEAGPPPDQCDSNARNVSIADIVHRYTVRPPHADGFGGRLDIMAQHLENSRTESPRPRQSHVADAASPGPPRTMSGRPALRSRSPSPRRERQLPLPPAARAPVRSIWTPLLGRAAPSIRSTPGQNVWTLRIGDLEPLAPTHLLHIVQEFLAPWMRWVDGIRPCRGTSYRGDALAYVDFVDEAAAMQVAEAVPLHRPQRRDGTYRNWHAKWAD